MYLPDSTLHKLEGFNFWNVVTCDCNSLLLFISVNISNGSIASVRGQNSAHIHGVYDKGTLSKSYMKSWYSARFVFYVLVVNHRVNTSWAVVPT